MRALLACVLLVGCHRAGVREPRAPVGDAPPAAPLPTVGVTAVFADPAAYDGKRVRMEGAVGPGGFEYDPGSGSFFTSDMACAELRCGPEDKCCNSCDSAANLVEGSLMGLRLVGKDAQEYGCEKRGCETTCRPAAGRYVVVGTIRVPKLRGTIDLLVETLEPAT